MDTIGERIVFLREGREMTQVKLAEKIGITKMTLYKYEKNICEPRGEIIANLADALNTTADFLLGRTKNQAPMKTNSITESTKELENNLIFKFRQLSSENQIRIRERIDVLLEQQGF
jgi:transcriptional regulator with XRE-family HTH domain